MAERDSLHQPPSESGVLAPVAYGIQVKKLPLLPFEKELIKLIGCSEDEYRFFAAEAEKRGRHRPAEYDLIPDVAAGPATPVLVNLAIGLALTAVSALLAPKPGRTESDREEITNRTLSGKRGPARFNPTFGFDSISEIESYGSAVPVPFGLYRGPETGDNVAEPHGGIVVTPKLVWSRMLSHGINQALKAMYVVGERDMGTVLENSTWLGTSILDGVYSSQYAIYWNTENPDGVGRITAGDFRYGSRGTPDSADTWNGNEVMVCPTHDGADRPGFCMAYTPSGNVEFGQYTGIPNGTDRKTDWKVISIPEQVENDDRQDEERKKISGNTRMAGAGRGYGRRMGIVEVDGQTFGARTLVEIRKGSTARFHISSSKYEEIYGAGVTLEDINEESIEERRRADDMLQIGVKVMIGQSMWLVTNRTSGIWEVGKTIDVYVKCINTLGDKTIGAVSMSMIDSTVLNDGGDDRTNANHIQVNFFPLLKAELAVIRPQRKIEFIEFGIRSNVWGRMNGLCFFRTTPGPRELEEFDDDNINLTTGQMNLYFTRYSYFQMQVRRAGDADLEDFVKIPVIFGVKGTSPVDQFNYIRLQPGNTSEDWEFRFVPITCAYITRDSQEAIILDAKANNIEERSTVVGAYGPFVVSASGYAISTINFETSELTRRPGKGGTDPYYTTERRPEAIDLLGWNPNVSGKSHAWRYEILGNPVGLPNNTYRQTAITIEKTFTVEEEDDDGNIDIVTKVRKVRVFIQAYSQTFDSPNVWGQTAVWLPHTYRINQTHPDTIDYADLWNDNDECNYTVSLSGGNPYRSAVGNSVTAEQRMNVGQTQVWNPGTPGDEEVVFENDTGIAEVSHYGDLISRSCDDGPEHAIAYCNESLVDEDDFIPQYGDLTTFGLVIRAGRSFQQMDQPRCWVRRGIKVRNLLDFDGPEKSSNNFADLVYWILTDKRAGIGKYVDPSLVRVAQMQNAARFIETNQMYFDGAIEDRTNARTLLYDLAPKFLCNFIIKNGRFGLAPAVPADEAGNIKDVVTPIAAIFSDGNIVEDSLQVSFLEAEERRDIQALLRYRRNRFRELPEELNVRVRWVGTGNTDVENSIDMTAFCTSRAHAELVGRYFLSIRRRVTHTISFKTTPYSLYAGPGDYIKVFTQSSPYSATRNGVVKKSGEVVAATSMPDGSYQVDFYRPGGKEVESGILEIVNGYATDPELAGAVFSSRLSNDLKAQVYQVEQLTLGEDGLVEISASYFPVDDDDISLIAKDLFDDSLFATLP